MIGKATTFINNTKQLIPYTIPKYRLGWESTGTKTFSEEEVLQLISTALERQQQQQPFMNTQIRILTPPNYDGTRDITKLNNWYATVGHYLNFYNFDKTRWVAYAVSLLTDHARLWYYPIIRQATYAMPTWEEFKIANGFRI